MGESTSQIERDIAAERNELGRNLQLLENKARSLADWRTYVRNHPYAMMGAALGGGVLLGVLTAGVGVSETTEYGTSHLKSDDDLPRYSSPSALSSSAARLRRQFGDTWDHIADALIGVASAKAIEFVSEMIPGFREQLAAKHPEHHPGFSGSRGV